MTASVAILSAFEVEQCPQRAVVDREHIAKQNGDRLGRKRGIEMQE
jgi:hypothetical protein